MKDLFEHVPEGAKVTIDMMSWVTILATIADILPAIAALLSIVWSCLRIYETETFQRLVKPKRGDGE